jgi:hypothetical protein
MAIRREHSKPASRMLRSCNLTNAFFPDFSQFMIVPR